MQLRVRGPSGQATLSGLESDTPTAELVAKIADATGVPAGAQEVLAGFPPKPLDLSAPTLAALGLHSGDSLTVRHAAGAAPAASAAPSPAPAPAPADGASAYAVAGMSEDEQLARAIAASLGEDVGPVPPAATAPASARAPAPRPAPAGPATLASLAANAPPARGSPDFEPLPDGTAVARRIVADDNSCLFSSIGYVARGGRGAAPQLRSLVAEAVLADPVEWNKAVLGKEPAAYAAWITDPRRWGGAIELSILSRRLGVEIAAFDVQTKRVDVYGQGEGYIRRVLTVYNGLHYDALAVAAAPGAPEAGDTLAVPSAGARTEEVMAGAAALVARAHAARQFTDTANFTLRCGTCRVGLQGEKEAVEHAQATGHANFTEY